MFGVHTPSLMPLPPGTDLPFLPRVAQACAGRCWQPGLIQWVRVSACGFLIRCPGVTNKGLMFLLKPALWLFEDGGHLPPSPLVPSLTVSPRPRPSLPWWGPSHSSECGGRRGPHPAPMGPRGPFPAAWHPLQGRQPQGGVAGPGMATAL